MAIACLQCENIQGMMMRFMRIDVLWRVRDGSMRLDTVKVCSLETIIA
jgi:hypothetical protein